MYTIRKYLKHLFFKRLTANILIKIDTICSRFYNIPSHSESMPSKPSLDDLRTWKYIKRSDSGTTHSRLWENSKTTIVVSLRLDESFFTYLDKQTGPKKRNSNRVVGKTPDASFLQPGRPAKGYSHQIRKELSRLLTMDIDRMVVMLHQNPNYKSGKKKKLTVRLPDLSQAIEELFEELLIRDKRLVEHIALRKLWIPAMCRLLEIRSMYQ